MNILFKSFLSFLLFLTLQDYSFGGEIISWKFKTDGRVYSTPLVVNNTVYIGSEDGNFYAINFDDGSEVWHYEVGSKILSTAAYSDGVICFESGNVLYGLNTDGTEKWKVTISEGNVTHHYDEWDYFHSSPNIVDGIAYVGSERGQVIGVDIQSGEESFRIDTGDDGVGIRAKPAVWDRKIYFGECSGIFYCYDISTGEQVWQYDTNPEKLWSDPSILTNPLVSDGIVYFGGRHCHLYALDAEKGTKVWWYSDPNNMWILGGPVISDSLLFVGSSNQKVLHCLSIDSNKLLWKKQFDGRIFGTPFLKEDKVFFGTGMELNDKIGNLFCINKNTGDIINRFEVNSQIHSSPIVLDNKVLFGAADGYVYALDEEEMLNCEHPETKYSDEGDIELGELKQDTTISVSIYNSSNVSDSVSFSWVSRRLDNYLSAEPQSLVLEPLSSYDISCSIKASEIAVGKHNVTLIMSRFYTLNPNDKQISKRITFEIPVVSSIDKPEVELEFNLSQNYPNPFNPVTIIKFTIPSVKTPYRASLQTKLIVYDILGREIKILLNELMQPGSYDVEFDGSDLPSGIYFYKLTANEFFKTRKMILMK